MARIVDCRWEADEPRLFQQRDTFIARAPRGGALLREGFEPLGDVGLITSIMEYLCSVAARRNIGV